MSFSIIGLIQVLFHAVPLLVAFRITWMHYTWRREGSKNVKQHVEETTKIVSNILFLLIFMTVYLSLDTFGYLKTIAKDVEDTKRSSEEILSKTGPSSLDSCICVNGTNGIYSEVEKVFQLRPQPLQKLQLDILGFTMSSTWPMLEPWMQKHYLNSLTINIFYLDEKYLESSPSFDPGWHTFVVENKKIIEAFKKKNKSYLQGNKVEINLIPYSHLPGVHGFRFNDGNYFVSFGSWDDSGKNIRPPNQDVFLILKSSNISLYPQSMRKLFDNWLTAAINDSKSIKN